MTYRSNSSKLRGVEKNIREASDMENNNKYMSAHTSAEQQANRIKQLREEGFLVDKRLSHKADLLYGLCLRIMERSMGELRGIAI